jgi:formate hydrogenlyase subunit 4
VAGLVNPLRLAERPVAAVAANLALTALVAVAIGLVESFAARLKLRAVPAYVLLAGASAAVALLATAWWQGGGR